jgi:hypothetical protein
MDRLRWMRLDAPAPWLLAVALALALVSAPAAAAGEAASHRPNRRVCPGPVVGAASCHSRVITDRNAEPLASSSPSGYGPADFHTAYALPVNAPTAQTIAIVDAYDSPTIESDLAVYSSTYGIPACTTANGCFRKVNQNGVEGSYPKKDGGWALEIALDVEAAHGICQNCKILLVEANSNLFSDLKAAVNTAAALGATQISNSYGGPEFAGEASDTAYDHPGIAITASAGDDGYAAEYPAASPYVVAVGGTTLNLGPSGSYGSETVWSGSGSGCSAYITARSWQTADSNWALTGCGTKRGVSDIAADANPNTGASVYDTTKVEGQSGWFTVGGTSLSAPLIAGVYALAGGSSSDYPAADPYAHQSDSPASLHDITSGSNGSCGSSTMCKGAVGYDGPTGVGTPKGIAAFGAGGGGVDTTPPQTTIDSGPSGPTNDATPSFGFSSSEFGSTFECRVDAAAFAGCASPFTSNALSDGAHVFEVRAKDAATNVDPTPAQRSFTVDTSGPQTTIDSGPSGLTNDSTPSFGFSSEQGASFQCRVDSASFAGCTSPYTSAALSDGAHSFEVRASDGVGNVDATPASRSFTVDTTPPQTTIDSGPEGITNDSTPTFGFSSEAGAGFECRVDAAAFAGCASPFTSNPLSDGAHTYQVRARDAATNVDPTPAQRSFTVDTTPPQTTIDSGPSGTTNDPTPSFAFSANETASFQCRVDSASFTSCSSPYESPSLGDGAHSFEVRSTDGAGNVDQSPAQRSFTVDTTPPQTTIDSGPEGITNDATPSFGSSSEAGASFECRVDSASFSGCTSPFTSGQLSDGAHTFEVRAKDAAANVDPTPAQRSFSVDTTPPQTTIDSGPEGIINDATPSFAFSANETASFECRVDSATFTTCTSPYAAASLSDGDHSFEVRAIDSAAIVDPTPAQRSFTVNTTAPQTTIDSGPEGITNDATPSFGFSSEAGASFECRVDSAAFAGCTSPQTTAALSDGGHTFQVRAKDAGNNVDPTPASRSFTVDTTPPDTALDSGPAGTTNDSTPSFTFSADEAGSTFQCGVDSAAFTPCSSPYTAAPLSDGAHSFEVRATDGAGNVDASPASRSFDVDTTAEPGVTLPETTLPETPPAETVPVLEPEVFPSPRIAPAPVTFSFDGIKHGEQGRTTKITVSIPGPGTLVLFGRKVRKVTRTTATGGSVSVPVEPKPRFRNGALGSGRTRVYVTYTPLGGAPVTRALSLRLS